MAAQQVARNELLSGLVVVDVSTIIGGPVAALLLAEYGATVIKIEQPRVGDGARHMGYGSTGNWWKFLSHHKRLVTLDLHDPRGVQVFRRLCARADVLVENFRPGTLEKWGLGWDVLHDDNVRLVMLRLSGFGQDGPYASRPGYGTLAEAMSGLAHLTGFPDGPPTLPGIPLADSLTGVTGANACMMALWARDRPGGTGTGQVIDLSLYGSLAYALGLYTAEHDADGVEPKRQGNRLGNAPRELHPCADGQWVAYSAQSASMMRRLVMFLGLESDPRFVDTASTLTNADHLDTTLASWIALHDRDEVIDTLIANDIPVAPVLDIPQLLNDEHVVARGDFVRVPDGAGRPIRLPRPPARFSSGDIASAPVGGELGADNDEIYLRWLRMPEAELAELRTAGVV